MVKQLIAQLERVAANESLPLQVREGARRDADGYRAALAKKMAQ